VNGPEFLPIAGGVLVGLFLGILRPSLRVRTGMVLVMGLGVLATLTSGEFRISWAFLGIDVPLTALSTAGGLMGMHVLRRLRRQVPGGQRPVGPT
jgi:hypothetical protein